MPPGSRGAPELADGVIHGVATIAQVMMGICKPHIVSVLRMTTVFVTKTAPLRHQFSLPGRWHPPDPVLPPGRFGSVARRLPVDQSNRPPGSGVPGSGPSGIMLSDPSLYIRGDTGVEGAVAA